jgi:hypothetical protein
MFSLHHTYICMGENEALEYRKYKEVEILLKRK